MAPQRGRGGELAPCGPGEQSHWGQSLVYVARKRRKGEEGASSCCRCPDVQESAPHGELLPVFLALFFFFFGAVLPFNQGVLTGGIQPQRKWNVGGGWKKPCCFLFQYKKEKRKLQRTTKGLFITAQQEVEIDLIPPLLLLQLLLLLLLLLQQLLLLILLLLQEQQLL